MAIFPTDPSSVTAQWLSEVLGADVRECRLEQIGIGVGLLGRLYRAHLEGGPGVPSSVVVKLPMLDPRVRSEVCEGLEFYLSEVRFYQEIGLANPLPPGASVLRRLRRDDTRLRPRARGSGPAPCRRPDRGMHRSRRRDRRRRHRPPPRPLVGERPLRVDAVAEDPRRTPVPRGFDQQLRGRLAALHRGYRCRPVRRHCVRSASGFPR